MSTKKRSVYARPYVASKPTIYNGVLYRSRLEARWAVFFQGRETINWFWYEPEILYLPDGSPYTPDFKISYSPYELRDRKPENQKIVYVEIKPSLPTDEYCERLMSIKHLSHNIMIIYGGFTDKRFGCLGIFKYPKIDINVFETSLAYNAFELMEKVNTYKF